MTTRASHVERLRVENESALPLFNQLVDDAVEICLSDPEIFQTHQHSKNTEGSNQLGVWGVRAALELDFNEVLYTSYVDDAPFTYESLKTDSEAIIPDAIPAVQSSIEAFGYSLLEDAFACLGDDAPSYVEQFKNAQTSDDQWKILEWLVERVCAIRDMRKHEGTENTEEIVINDLPEITLVPLEETIVESPTETVVVEWRDGESQARQHFYHPSRLSPKLIGRYPEITLPPTCLSTSMLISSFFEKTDAAYLHGGVMLTADDMNRLTMKEMAEIVDHEAYKRNLILPDLVQSKLLATHEANEKVIRDNSGFHAVVYVRLIEGEWVQLDPNFEGNIGLHGIDGERMGKVYSALTSVNETSKGVEVGARNIESLFMDFFAENIIDLTETLPTSEEIEESLQAIEASRNIFESTKRYIFERFYKAISREHELPSSERLIDGILFAGNEGKMQKYRVIDDLLDRMVETYVFTDLAEEGEDGVLRLLQTDEHYRQRRREDLLMTPFYLALALTSMTSNALIKIERSGPIAPHAAVELGTPAYRIGAAVLSDLALYTETDIPFSFWVSHWPSYVTYGNHVPDIEEKDQSHLLRKMLLCTDMDWLSYIASRGIIRKFLEQKDETEQ